MTLVAAWTASELSCSCARKLAPGQVAEQMWHRYLINCDAKMALHLETILLDQGVEADTQGSYAATNGVLFVLCTSALIFTGVVLMLHAST
jgi:hypothetical protein